ncbi:MAG TPA: hypothetical protein VIN08_15110 [Ohtaekwangia sp.]|uniref:hypothetical protein n=1 Tax=Ohtaekwangia sp. TaxID=2066019 RepID=UPI002F953905
MLDFLKKTPIPEGHDESRVLAFRYYLLAITFLSLLGIVFELIIDFRSISVAYLTVLAITPALLLTLSLLQVNHRWLVVSNILFILTINQVQIINNPMFFHTWVFWMGLTPLFLTMFTRTIETILLTVIILCFIITNGIYVSSGTSSYETVILPINFTAAGVLFTLVTATIAILFGYTQQAVNTRLVKQNLMLQSLTVEIEQQNKLLKDQNEEITQINNRLEEANFHLEERVAERTLELEGHNKKLTEYAFINSHLLRGPLCSILGLINLLNNAQMSDAEKEILTHLKQSSHNLDDVVSKIGKALATDPSFDRDTIRNLKV